MRPHDNAALAVDFSCHEYLCHWKDMVCTGVDRPSLAWDQDPLMLSRYCIVNDSYLKWPWIPLNWLFGLARVHVETVPVQLKNNQNPKFLTNVALSWNLWKNLEAPFNPTGY